jgi:hypothetical protein
MKKPETYFAAREFRLNNDDVTYHSNSRRRSIQQIVEVIALAVRPIGTVNNTATGR